MNDKNATLLEAALSSLGTEENARVRGRVKNAAVDLQNSLSDLIEAMSGGGSGCSPSCSDVTMEDQAYNDLSALSGIDHDERMFEALFGNARSIEDDLGHYLNGWDGMEQTGFIIRYDSSHFADDFPTHDFLDRPELCVAAGAKVGDPTPCDSVSDTEADVLYSFQELFVVGEELISDILSEGWAPSSPSSDSKKALLERLLTEVCLVSEKACRKAVVHGPACERYYKEMNGAYAEGGIFE